MIGGESRLSADTISGSTGTLKNRTRHADHLGCFVL
jgi:hypothetical protein